MSVITHLYRLRGHFATLPRLQVPPGEMRGLEWSGKGKEKGAKDLKTIPAIPDQVFNPLMAESLRWVDVYSDDIIRLLHLHDEASARFMLWNSNSYAGYINEALVGFKFSKSPITQMPWRQELRHYEEVEEEDEEGSKKKYLTPLNVLRRLVSSLLAACSIVVQGFTGIRLSELLGLSETSGERGELPSCVSIRPGIDDLNDVFVMTGPIFKGAVGDNEREGQWVVGIRPMGTTFVPEVVRALNTVLRVTEHWRELTDDRNVFINSKSHGNPPAN
ncbi:hypothetical protein ELI37_36930 [Rhizobium leguminosarum]|uniref:hypothetical protein n=1 Tax=Rhizobium leguminosarum TaxID=384 RepID=UPI00102FECF6|nr:hypothetical protein [Rhizobium leguminosarum]TAU92521.1 hypothetical protein ELI37_36930 [Rhizobium leguminosarum]